MLLWAPESVGSQKLNLPSWHSTQCGVGTQNLLHSKRNAYLELNCFSLNLREDVNKIRKRIKTCEHKGEKHPRQMNKYKNAQVKMTLAWSQKTPKGSHWVWSGLSACKCSKNEFVMIDRGQIPWRFLDHDKECGFHDSKLLHVFFCVVLCRLTPQLFLRPHPFVG